MTRLLAFFKLPGVIPGALVVLGLAIALWVQTTRLGSSQETVRAQGTTITTLQQRVKDDALAIGQRDTLIAKQNEAVRLILQADQQAQAAYQARIAAADLTAKAHDQRAQAILSSQPAPGADRCHAALQLIQQTIKN